MVKTDENTWTVHSDIILSYRVVAPCTVLKPNLPSRRGHMVIAYFSFKDEAEEFVGRSISGLGYKVEENQGGY